MPNPKRYFISSISLETWYGWEWCLLSRGRTNGKLFSNSSAKITPSTLKTSRKSSYQIPHKQSKILSSPLDTKNPQVCLKMSEWSKILAKSLGWMCLQLHLSRVRSSSSRRILAQTWLIHLLDSSQLIKSVWVKRKRGAKKRDPSWAWRLIRSNLPEKIETINQKYCVRRL